MRKLLVWAVLIIWSVSCGAASGKTRESHGTATASVAPTDAGVTALLDRHLPEVKFEANQLSEVADFLSDVSGMSIVVKWQALDELRIQKTTPITVAGRDVTVGKTLTDVLMAASGGEKKLGYAVRHGAVVISTVEDLANPAMEPRLPRGTKTEANAATEKLLDRALPLEGRLPNDTFDHEPGLQFQGNKLADCIDWFHNDLHVNIVAKWEILEAASISRDEPVDLKLNTPSVRQALLLMLETAGGSHVRLEYAIVDGVVTIATKEDFDKQLVVRKYPVADLIRASAPMRPGHTLADRVWEEIVDPDVWDGPDKGVETVGDELVVEATLENQQKVEKLLEKLRKPAEKK